MKKPQWVYIPPPLLLLIYTCTLLVLVVVVVVIIVFSSPDIALIVRPHINRCVTFICVYIYIYVYILSFFVTYSSTAASQAALCIGSSLSLSHPQSQTHKKSSSYLYSSPLSFLWVWIPIEQFFFFSSFLFYNYLLFYFIIFYNQNIIIVQLYKVLYRPISHRATSYIFNGMITL